MKIIIYSLKKKMINCRHCGFCYENKNYKESSDVKSEDNCKELEKIINQKNISILNLQINLQYEQMKNKIYTQIIESQTNIKLDEIIKDSEKQIDIHDFTDGNIQILLHNFIKSSNSIQIQEYNIEPLKKVKKKPKKKIEEEQELIIEIEEGVDIVEPDIKCSKPKFRRVKDYIKTSEKELNTKLKEDIVKVEKKLEEIVYNNFDVSQKEIIESIEQLFIQLQNNRIYTPNLNTIKDLRKKLLGKINLEEYISLVMSHVKRLEDIFSNKKYNIKKINKIISTSLTPLDARFIHYEGYTNISIEVDELQKFGLVLGILVHHDKNFVPYDKQLFFKNIKNYGLSLFELQESIERCLVNRYGCHNIIYVNRDNSKQISDPYSFYILDNVKDSNRLWKMECRLEDFTLDLISSLLPYCIHLFRKIYKDVFTDNIYRPDYIYKSQITEFDCEQLLQNIILLSKPNILYKTLQQIIINNCTFTITEIDKFDFHGDDKLQQKRLAKAIDKDEDIHEVFKRLFDQMSTDDCIHLLSSKNS
jgi:hypothetical protein